MRSVPGHKIRFWAYTTDGERIPRNPTMADKDWGWDATCSCGWDSKTGGAIMTRVDEAVAEHKAEAAGTTVLAERTLAKLDEANSKYLGLPQKSFEFFVQLVQDAGNWSGTPRLDANVAAGRSTSGMSQTLVRRGLVTIEHDEDGAFVVFTEAGKAAAVHLGYTI